MNSMHRDIQLILIGICIGFMADDFFKHNWWGLIFDTFWVILLIFMTKPKIFSR